MAVTVVTVVYHRQPADLVKGEVDLHGNENECTTVERVRAAWQRLSVNSLCFKIVDRAGGRWSLPSQRDGSKKSLKNKIGEKKN